MRVRPGPYEGSRPSHLLWPKAKRNRPPLFVGSRLRYWLYPFLKRPWLERASKPLHFGLFHHQVHIVATVAGVSRRFACVGLLCPVPCLLLTVGMAELFVAPPPTPFGNLATSSQGVLGGPKALRPRFAAGLPFSRRRGTSEAWVDEFAMNFEGCAHAFLRLFGEQRVNFLERRQGEVVRRI
jgi:hypothetical protein